MKAIYIIIFATFSYIAQGQIVSDNVDLKGFRIGITPSSFFNVYTGVQGNLSYGFHEQIEVALNAGYIPSFLDNPDENGYRYRIMLKIAPFRTFSRNTILGNRIFTPYFGLGYHHRFITQNNEEVQIAETSSSELRSIITVRKRTLTGIPLMIGQKVKITDNAILDVGFGWGIFRTQEEIEYDELPPFQVFEDLSFFTDLSPGIKNNPLIIGHLSVSWKI